MTRGWVVEGCPLAPHLWIPAFAGMTREGWGRNDEGCGRARVGARQRPFDRLRANGGRPRPALPLWIPAFAGMTTGVGQG